MKDVYSINKGIFEDTILDCTEKITCVIKRLGHMVGSLEFILRSSLIFGGVAIVFLLVNAFFLGGSPFFVTVFFLGLAFFLSP